MHRWCSRRSANCRAPCLSTRSHVWGPHRSPPALSPRQRCGPPGSRPMIGSSSPTPARVDFGRPAHRRPPPDGHHSGDALPFRVPEVRQTCSRMSPPLQSAMVRWIPPGRRPYTCGSMSPVDFRRRDSAQRGSPTPVPRPASAPARANAAPPARPGSPRRAQLAGRSRRSPCAPRRTSGSVPRFQPAR